MEESLDELNRLIDAAYALFEETGDEKYRREGRRLIKEHRARQGIPYSAP